jgi:AcrR family transcriptional regulator
MSRLSDERFAELYDGTLQLVAEHGFDRVTMDQIAEATHSSKATLYRQWGSKAALVTDAMVCTVEDHHDPVDTGHLRSDLHQMLTEEKPRGIDDGKLVGALLHAVRTHPELEQALREKVFFVGRERIGLIAARAVERGEVAADCPGIDYIPLLLIAQVILQPVLDGTPWDDATKLHYVDDVLLPILGVY